MVRQDKYQVGDQVELDPTFPHYDHLAHRFRSPGTVEKVIDLPSKNWQAVGHTQWLIVSGLWGEVSGAYFKPIAR